jgi:hypothetical protein
MESTGDLVVGVEIIAKQAQLIDELLAGLLESTATLSSSVARINQYWPNKSARQTCAKRSECEATDLLEFRRPVAGCGGVDRCQWMSLKTLGLFAYTSKFKLIFMERLFYGRCVGICDFCSISVNFCEMGHIPRSTMVTSGVYGALGRMTLRYKPDALSPNPKSSKPLCRCVSSGAFVCL